MRYLFRLLCVCALGVMPVAGCSEAGAPECLYPFDEDFDPIFDRNCYDECNTAFCGYGNRCHYVPDSDGRSCDGDGVSGVCVNGVCAENICEGVVCEDGDLCTIDRCDYVDGTCYFTPRGCDDLCNYGNCDPDSGECVKTPKPDGTSCCIEDYPGPCWGPCGCEYSSFCKNGECF